MQPFQEVPVDLLRTVCGDCSQEFDTPHLSDFAYAERLFYTSDGRDVGYGLLLSDPVFDEVHGIARRLLHGSGLSEQQVVDKANAAFGHACDPINGKPVVAGAGPACPRCGGRDIEQSDYHR
jgi:hypothetical protein